MIKDNKYYYSLYESGLKTISELGIVTREQAEVILGCHTSKPLVLCSHNLLKLIKISACNLYTTHNTDLTNRQIKRSVLLAQFCVENRDAYIASKNNKTDKSLMQKNVIYLGHTDKHDINHYLILGVNNRSYTQHEDYKELADLVKEIYLKDGTERIRLYFLHSYANFNYSRYEQALFNNKELSGLESKINQGLTILSLKNLYREIPILSYI